MDTKKVVVVLRKDEPGDLYLVGVFDDAVALQRAKVQGQGLDIVFVANQNCLHEVK